MLNKKSNANHKSTTMASDPDQYMEMMEAKNQKAIKFLTSRRYETVTQFGQRISINRDLFISPQEEEDIRQTPWNEVFVGHLPRDLFEDELLPIMEQAGRVYRIRYMMDFSQSNRGFAFFQYVSRQDAIRAWAFLDDQPVREGTSRIGVKLSFNNKRLFFGNLPADCTSDQLIAALRNHGIKGVESANMADDGMVNGRGGRGYLFGRSPAPNGFDRHGLLNSKDDRSSRFCYVYFESHDDATQARRMLLPCEATLFNRKLTCDWAKSSIPEDILREKERMQQQRFVKNNNHHLNNNDIPKNLSNSNNLIANKSKHANLNQVNYNHNNNINLYDINNNHHVNLNHQYQLLQSRANQSQIYQLHQEQLQQQQQSLLNKAIMEAWPILNLLSEQGIVSPEMPSLVGL